MTKPTITQTPQNPSCTEASLTMSKILETWGCWHWKQCSNRKKDATVSGKTFQLSWFSYFKINNTLEIERAWGWDKNWERFQIMWSANRSSPPIYQYDGPHFTPLHPNIIFSVKWKNCSSLSFSFYKKAEISWYVIWWEMYRCFCQHVGSFWSIFNSVSAYLRPQKITVHSDLNSHTCYDFLHVIVCPRTELFAP